LISDLESLTLDFANVSAAIKTRVAEEPSI
jgi:hypothetical protein